MGLHSLNDLLPLQSTYRAFRSTETVIARLAVIFSPLLMCARVFRTSIHTFFGSQFSMPQMKNKFRKFVLEGTTLKKYSHVDSVLPKWSVNLKGLFHSLLLVISVQTLCRICHVCDAVSSVYVDCLSFCLSVCPTRSVIVSSKVP